ncbi:MAG TPA: hypothetical protein VNM72_02790 [Blastocatellia bacterium]|nr:hypothetical protein [Blastocatellia bacterium]
MGLGLVVRQDYRVINLRELDAETVLSQRLSVVASFVPVMGGTERDGGLVGYRVGAYR